MATTIARVADTGAGVSDDEAQRPSGDGRHSEPRGGAMMADTVTLRASGETWTVRRDAVLMVHAWRHNGGFGSRCSVLLATGVTLECEAKYRDLCEQLWPGSTGYASELAQKVSEMEATVAQLSDKLAAVMEAVQ